LNQSGFSRYEGTVHTVKAAIRTAALLLPLLGSLSLQSAEFGVDATGRHLALREASEERTFKPPFTGEAVLYLTM
jgi:hypothetical protein